MLASGMYAGNSTRWSSSGECASFASLSTTEKENLRVLLLLVDVALGLAFYYPLCAAVNASNPPNRSISLSRSDSVFWTGISLPLVRFFRTI